MKILETQRQLVKKLKKNMRVNRILREAINIRGRPAPKTGTPITILRKGEKLQGLMF